MERNSTVERYRYTISAAARNGSMTDEVYAINESENAPDRTRLVGLEDIRTTDATGSIRTQENCLWAMNTHPY